jgi:hypothetical protein
MKIAIMASFPAKGNVNVDAGHGCKHREKEKAKAKAKAKAEDEEESEIANCVFASLREEINRL